MVDRLRCISASEIGDLFFNSRQLKIPFLETLETPTLKSRLASMLYEGVLLFGVLFIADWLFSTSLEQRHALHFRNAGQVWLFLVLGIYFIWFWRHGGQTLAMKTWGIRLVDENGRDPSYARAAVRYLLVWLWFVPGLALAWVLGAQAWMLLFIPMANLLLWALTVYLDPQRQFLHDRLAGTRLVKSAVAPKK